MSGLKIERDEIIQSNRHEYGDRYQSLNFITPIRAKTATVERAELLSRLDGQANFNFKNTKLFTGALSPGCKICGAGSWSCLFINGRCNCRCFYCPTSQDEDDLPTTNTLRFPKADEYVNYIKQFNFCGVSFSGGEPFLTLENTFSYLSAVKNKFGDLLYTWLYTNGTLVTRELLLQLKNLGLNEIRFDISAVNYQLDKVKLAAEILDCVTVEIPAIPEDFELMKKKLADIRDVGVKHLNLHQLRLTPHNFKNLTQRSYTFLHGAKVTVLESELTALKLMLYVLEQKIDLPINYCSFVYKNRFQQAAARKRTAQLIKKEVETTTENGCLRSLSLAGNPDKIRHLAEHLHQSSFWHLSSSGDRLYFAPDLWKKIDKSQFTLFLKYSLAQISDSLSYFYPFTKLQLTEQRNVFIERITASKEFEIKPNEIDFIEKLIINQQPENALPTMTPRWSKILGFERIAAGLQDYF